MQIIGARLGREAGRGAEVANKSMCKSEFAALEVEDRRLCRDRPNENRENVMKPYALSAMLTASAVATIDCGLGETSRGIGILADLALGLFGF